MDSGMGTLYVLWRDEKYLASTNTGQRAASPMNLIRERAVAREIIQLNTEQFWGPVAQITSIRELQDSQVYGSSLPGVEWRNGNYGRPGNQVVWAQRAPYCS